MAYANYAYQILNYQGYDAGRISYLTDQQDARGRTGPATKAQLMAAINAAKDENGSSLIIYLVDHGETERFELRGGQLAEYVSAEELDVLLDDFQNVTEAPVLFVYDACRSGSFAPLMQPPAGKARVVITSTAADESAYFIDENSFSKHFWSTFAGGSGSVANLPNAWLRVQ